MSKVSFSKLLAIIKETNPQADLDLVRLAYDFAAAAHEGQKRASGEPYINHSLGTAVTLAQMKLDLPIILAGLFHDIPEDTDVTLAEIEKNFGRDIAAMVEGITKLGKLKYRGVERYLENLRKMFVAMAKDVRVILIKFADRLNNLESLDFLPPNKRLRIALESLEIYAPIANRLGMGEMKGQLEDLSFKYINPKEYKFTVDLVQQKYDERKKSLQQIKTRTEQELKAMGIKVISFHGRVKHLYSLYKKFLRHEQDITKIYDLVALRLVMEDLADCYATLGVIHKLWKPMPARIKDYIAQPKPNGYQSIHTTVFCLEGEIVEFQIRTLKMHEEAEFGIAAHWRYDEKGAAIPPRQLSWVKELAAMQEKIFKSLKDVDALKIDIFQNRIFAFTPKGDVLDLPENATPVDFAYAIHTDLGNQCVGARLNGHMASLDQTIKSGDMVEIIIDKNRRGPSIDWLKFVKTSLARDRVKMYAKSSLAGWLKRKILSEKLPKAKAL